LTPLPALAINSAGAWNSTLGTTLLEQHLELYTRRAIIAVLEARAVRHAGGIKRGRP
jgi:hypothetical protein